MSDGDGAADDHFAPPPEWCGPSDDPNDEQFGDAVERASLADLDEYDAVIAGEPYDGAVIGRRGAAEAPAAVRESLAATKTHHVDIGAVARDGRSRASPGHDHGSTEQPLALGDLGDVTLPDPTEGDGPDVASTQERVRAVTERLYGRGVVPVFLGGDNSLTYPNAAPLLDRGSLGVISFDAHLDCRAVREGVGPTSGTPYRQLFGDGLDELAVLGARNFETSTAYHDYLHERGGRVFTPAEVAADPIDAIDDAIASLGDVDAIYVSVDLDVLDAAAAPGVSAPTPGGLSTRELYRLLGHVATHGRVAGFEVVECAPPLDESGRTVAAAARAVAHFLASLAAPKGRHSRRGALDG